MRDERGEHEQTKGSTIPDFEGGMGDFRKNMSCRLISREKKFLQGNTWRKKFLHWNSLRSRPVFSRAVFSCAHYTSKRLLRRLTRKIYLSWCVMLEKNLSPLYVRKNNPITRPLNTTKYIWSNSSRKSRFWHNDKHLKPISTAQSYSISRMVGRPARALLSNRMFF